MKPSAILVLMGCAILMPVFAHAQDASREATTGTSTQQHGNTTVITTAPGTASPTAPATTVVVEKPTARDAITGKAVEPVVIDEKTEQAKEKKMSVRDRVRSKMEDNKDK